MVSLQSFGAPSGTVESTLVAWMVYREWPDPHRNAYFRSLRSLSPFRQQLQVASNSQRLEAGSLEMPSPVAGLDYAIELEADPNNPNPVGEAPPGTLDLRSETIYASLQVAAETVEAAEEVAVEPTTEAAEVGVTEEIGVEPTTEAAEEAVVESAGESAVTAVEPTTDVAEVGATPQPMMGPRNALFETRPFGSGFGRNFWNNPRPRRG